jgi:cation diffusion facilitator CzcD-associated flavoprotein CzcO
VDVYQRTAGWVVPRRDRTYHRWERFAFAHIPGYLRLTRAGMYWIRELYGIGFGYRPDLLRSAERVARRHIERQVHDPALRAAVTPTFHIGCKRILLANDWYPALQRSNVELITNPISQVRPAGIVTADGTVRDVDAIVAATGFHVTDSPTADLIKGADGRTLGEHRREFGQRAYKGTTVAGFPNFFSLVGPNTGVGHTSLLYMIESQINYVLDALDVMDRLGLGSVEVRQDVQDAYNEELQRRMRRTVWMTGCASWYLDAEGRNTTLWPRFTFAFRKITRHFDVSAYRTTPRAD